MIDYRSDHHCPVYRRVITANLCYDSMMCLTGWFKISSTKELAEVNDVPTARKACKMCQYSDLTGDEEDWPDMSEI